MANLSDLSMTLDNVRRLYKDDRILDCLTLIRDVERQLEHVAATPADDTTEDITIAREIREILDGEVFRRIKREGERAERLYTTLTADGAHPQGDQLPNQDAGWTLSYDGPETKVWYKKNDDGFHSIRMQGSINAPLLHVAALLYESDLYAYLFWYVTASHTLPLVDDESDEDVYSQSNSLKRAVHITTFAPWPLYRRDVTLYAYAVDALQTHNCVIVLSSSISDNLRQLVSYIPDTERRVVRAVIHESGFMMTPVSPDVTKACFTYHIDPQLDIIPVALINWAARTMCRWSIRVLESRARNLDAVSPLYNQRLQQRPVYHRIRNRIEQYWQENRTMQEASGEPEVANERQDSETLDPNERPAVPSSIFRLLRQK